LVGLPNLQQFFLSNNRLTQIDSATQPNQLNSCDLSHNPFKCPIPGWTQWKCSAGCSNIKPSNRISDTLASVQ